MGRNNGKWRGFPASEYSGVGGSEGGREPSGVAENLGGDRQGVGGGVELPRGINTPGVEELPRGDETPGVTPEGDRVPGGADGGGEGTENPPAPEKLRRARTSVATRRLQAGRG